MPGPVSPAGAPSSPAFDHHVVETSNGPVEYAVLGRGAPVLVVHGSPGGIDSAALMAGFLPREQIAAIVFSRPGYLGTPLAGRETIDQQADLGVALLDALEIPRAGILSWSGGGPMGYRLAVRHPDRVAALVAFAALSHAYAMPRTNVIERLMFTTSAGLWLLRVLATHRPREFITGALNAEGSLTRKQLEQRVGEVLGDDTKREFVLALGPTAAQDRPRRWGFCNDLDQFAAIGSLDLEAITAPTLVIHGDADADVELVHGRYAADRIPGAELLVLETGTHLALYTHPESDSAQARAVEMLLRR